jgi:hypothetical protein
MKFALKFSWEVGIKGKEKVHLPYIIDLIEIRNHNATFVLF